MALALCGLCGEVRSQEPPVPSDDGQIVTLPAATKAPKQKIDSRGRARVRALAALGGLVILGLALIAATWMGGRMTRRYMKSGDKEPVRPVDSAFTDDWASKPLTLQERARLDSSEW